MCKLFVIKTISGFKFNVQLDLNDLHVRGCFGGVVAGVLIRIREETAEISISF